MRDYSIWECPSFSAISVDIGQPAKQVLINTLSPIFQVYFNTFSLLFRYTFSRGNWHFTFCMGFSVWIFLRFFLFDPPRITCLTFRQVVSFNVFYCNKPAHRNIFFATGTSPPNLVYLLFLPCLPQLSLNHFLELAFHFVELA